MFQLAQYLYVHTSARGVLWSIRKRERNFWETYMDERECVVVDVLRVLYPSIPIRLYRRHQQ